MNTHAYVFIGPGAWGFTFQADAANLPVDRGPWSFFRNASIPPVGEGSMEEARVLNDLKTRGVSLQPF